MGAPQHHIGERQQRQHRHHPAGGAARQFHDDGDRRQSRNPVRPDEADAAGVERVLSHVEVDRGGQCTCSYQPIDNDA